MRLTTSLILLLLSITTFSTTANAAELHFKNGDVITATVIGQTDTTITVDSYLFGEKTFDKDVIVFEKSTAITEAKDLKPMKVKPKVVAKPLVEPEPKKADDESDWTKKVSVGYSQSGGNTEKSSFSGDITVEKVTGDKEYKGKYSAFVSSSDKNQDARKFKAIIRYANKFGENKQWYNFYKVDGDQDRFSNVEYRFVPSVGYGYWFYNRDDLKLKAETAVGWEHTSYVDGAKSDNEMVIIPQGYFEKKLSDDLTFSQDLTLYPSLTETSKIRLTSETNLIGALTDNTSWKFSFIDDYNSEPKGTAEKNDYKLISSIEYNF